jgi:serine/threonine protein kinase
VGFALQIAMRLTAGRQGIVHRDLKPENVFVAADERVKDLGISGSLSSATG